tara:strand:- start:2113 stop:2358 length:246 start_codon:yes stop_codon:yes gene_type:complete
LVEFLPNQPQLEMGTSTIAELEAGTESVGMLARGGAMAAEIGEAVGGTLFAGAAAPELVAGAVAIGSAALIYDAVEKVWPF